MFIFITKGFNRTVLQRGCEDVDVNVDVDVWMHIRAIFFENMSKVCTFE